MYALSEQNITSEVEEIQDSFNEGVYKTCIELFQGARSEVDLLKDRINNCQKQIRLEKAVEQRNRKLYDYGYISLE